VKKFEQTNNAEQKDISLFGSYSYYKYNCCISLSFWIL